MEIKIVITAHAQQRIRERGANLAGVKAAIRRAVSQAPEPKRMTAIRAALPVIPMVRFFRTSTVVVTVLPADAIIDKQTAVVYV